MKFLFRVLILCCGTMSIAAAAVGIDEAVLGDRLGGWKTHSKKYAQYTISGVKYRTYRPEATITPDGGTYVSIRIDHVRGWFSSDDHAILEITVDRNGHIISAQSNIAIQGQSISSDVIMGASKASQNTVSSIDRAVQIGADLVANLSSKLLRAKLIEAGRVSFPSAVRHNYNLLFQAIQVDGRPVPRLKSVPVVEKPVEKPVAVEKPEQGAAPAEEAKEEPAADEKPKQGEAEKPAEKSKEDAKEVKPAAENVAEDKPELNGEDAGAEAPLVIKDYNGVPSGGVPKK